MECRGKARDCSSRSGPPGRTGWSSGWAIASWRSTRRRTGGGPPSCHRSPRELPMPWSAPAVDVHGPSTLFDPEAFRWTDQRWAGLRPGAFVFYELHVGTFTEAGTLDAAADRLPELV